MKIRIKLNAILIGLLFTSLIPSILMLTEIFVIAGQQQKIEWLTTSAKLLGYVSYIAGIYLTMRLAKESRILNAGIVVMLDMLFAFVGYALIRHEIESSPTTLQLIMTWGTLIRISLVPLLYLLIKKIEHREIITSH